MRAILVDDEHLALNLLKRLLEEDIGGVEIMDMLVDPQQALERCQTLRPDVVFLDIHMPGMNGLSLGEKLLEADPQLEIVFVTAYDDYAVRAFDLCAMDYILKPVDPSRLRQTVDRLRQKVLMYKEIGSLSESPFTTRS